MKPISKILFLLPFLILSGTLYYFADLKDLASYNSSFVSTSLAIATFSISFSFLQYQFSPYKALLRSISKRHLKYCCYTVLLALIPLAVLMVKKSDVPAAGIFCIPILVYGAILMPIIANEETDPRVHLKSVTQRKKLKRFLHDYKSAETKSKEKRELLEFDFPNETPMHSYSSKYNISVIPNDPFALIRNVIELALKNGDQLTFEKAISSFFTLIDNCIKEEIIDYKSGIRFSINTLVKETFEVILGQVIASKNIPQVSSLIYAVGDFVKEKAFAQLQTTAPYSDLVKVLVNYAKTAMEDNYECVVYLTSLCRELTQKGIYDPEVGESALFFKNALTTFPNYIKGIGQEAVIKKNSDVVYRCLEDLGFLGCTAVKQNHIQVVIECLQGLVQLGREARANDVRCFWRHCALDMVDHADERIEWMLTWLPRLPEGDYKILLESFETAYSRLHGMKQSITFERESEKIVILFNKTDEKHLERYGTGKYYKSVDYSDNSEIKEFKLY